MNRKKQYGKIEWLVFGIVIGFILALPPIVFLYNKYDEACGTQELIDIHLDGKHLHARNKSGYVWFWSMHQDGSIICKGHGDLVARNKEEARQMLSDLLREWKF